MEVEISDFLRAENLEPKITTSDGKRDIVHDYRPEVVYPRKANADALKELLEELRRDALARRRNGGHRRFTSADCHIRKVLA